MPKLIKNQAFELVAESIRPDERNRISLAKVMAKTPTGKRRCAYRVYRNPVGQIVLQPVGKIPAHEQWLYDNPKALASVRRGLKQAAEGEVTEMGSFFGIKKR